MEEQNQTVQKQPHPITPLLYTHKRKNGEEKKKVVSEQPYSLVIKFFDSNNSFTAEIESNYFAPKDRINEIQNRKNSRTTFGPLTSREKFKISFQHKFGEELLSDNKIICKECNNHHFLVLLQEKVNVDCGTAHISVEYPCPPVKFFGKKHPEYKCLVSIEYQGERYEGAVPPIYFKGNEKKNKEHPESLDEIFAKIPRTDKELLKFFRNIVSLPDSMMTLDFCSEVLNQPIEVPNTEKRGTEKKPIFVNMDTFDKQLANFYLKYLYFYALSKWQGETNAHKNEMEKLKIICENLQTIRNALNGRGTGIPINSARNSIFKILVKTSSQQKFEEIKPNDKNEYIIGLPESPADEIDVQIEVSAKTDVVFCNIEEEKIKDKKITYESLFEMLGEKYRWKQAPFDVTGLTMAPEERTALRLFTVKGQNKQEDPLFWEVSRIVIWNTKQNSK